MLPVQTECKAVYSYIVMKPYTHDERFYLRYAMIKTCWEESPEKRPTFSQINDLLDQYLEELAGYINTQLCLFPEIQQHNETV